MLNAGLRVLLGLAFAAVGALKLVNGLGDLALLAVAHLPFAHGLRRVLEPPANAVHDAGLGAVTVLIATFVINRANRAWKERPR